MSKKFDTIIRRAEKKDIFSMIELLGELFDIESREARNSIIKALPNEANHMEGESPLTGKGYLTLRVLALHLEYGYTKEEIGKFFFYKGRTISASTVDKYTRELRTYMVENRLV